MRTLGVRELRDLQHIRVVSFRLRSIAVIHQKASKERKRQLSAYRLCGKLAVLCCHTAGSFNAIAVIHQLIGSANISIILELALDHCYQLWMLFSSIQNWCSDDTALDVI